jgi:hypothetical protein
LSNQAGLFLYTRSETISAQSNVWFDLIWLSNYWFTGNTPKN